MANETYTLIQKTTLNAAATTIEFSNIPQTFTDLVIKVSAKASGAGSSALAIQFNSTTSTYTTKRLYGDGSGGYSDSSATTNYLKVGFVSQVTGTNNFGNTEIYIPNYTSANQKSVSTDSVAEQNTTNQYMSIMAGLWNGTSAITNIKLNIDGSLADFVQYSSFSLYGVAKLGVTPTGIPKATGGNIITNDGTYWIHQFLSSGAFVPNQTLNTEYLVIAGGGGGGWGAAGAGGYRTNVGGTALVATAQPYVITVGAGGTAGGKATPSGSYGSGPMASSGTNSSYSSISATGGGYGATYSQGHIAAASGGSGGGGSYGNNAFGSGNTGGYSPVEGYRGGYGYSSASAYGGGGGGGSAAIGGDGTTSVGGNGGAGTASSITGTSVTRASGGGGGAQSPGTAGTAPAGGGGNGTNGTGTATSGTIATGGGGGGSDGKGGAGGSGIVIIRYAM